MAAQFTFIKGKEYKVVNWIDGAVYVTTFSAAGKESTVRSAVTIAKVMAALVEQAHAEALEVEAERKEARRVAEVVRAEFYLHNPVFQRDFITAAHDEALTLDEKFNKEHTVQVRADEVPAYARIVTAAGCVTVRNAVRKDNFVFFNVYGDPLVRECYAHTMISVLK